MGYYVNTEDINIMVPKDLLEPAYQALLKLNENDDLKQGGSYGPGEKREHWFSWMPKDLSVLGDLKGVITNMGFEDSHYDKDRNLVFGHYNNKTGQEDLLVDAIAEFIQEGSYAIWKGEDDSYWKWEFADGKMRIIPGEAEITWLTDKAYTARESWNETKAMLHSFRIASVLTKKESSDA